MIEQTVVGDNYELKNLPPRPNSQQKKRRCEKTEDELLKELPQGVDKLMLEPGAWGRYEGLHVRKDLAEAFLGQGPTMMRLGGSMTNTDGFRFKYMVGPSWSRPPTDSNWIKKTSWG